MARYKPYCYEQTKLLPISFSQQILSGTFEYRDWGRTGVKSLLVSGNKW